MLFENVMWVVLDESCNVKGVVLDESCDVNDDVEDEEAGREITVSLIEDRCSLIEDRWSVKYKAPLDNSYTNPTVSRIKNNMPIQNPYVLTWYSVTAKG